MRASNVAYMLRITSPNQDWCEILLKCGWTSFHFEIVLLSRICFFTVNGPWLDASES